MARRSPTRAFALLVSACLLLVLAPALATDHDDDLMLDDASSLDRFGANVGVTSQTIAVARSIRPGPGGIEMGVHLFERSATLGWVEVARLTRAESRFGQDLAIDGDWLAVSGGGACGVVHLYHRGDAGWEESSTVAPDPCDDGGFGEKLALSGERLAVSDGEAVHLYEPGADSWALRTTIPIEGAVIAVALDGDRLAVLWQGLGVDDPSKVFVYDLAEEPLEDPAVLSPDLRDLILTCADVAVDGTRVIMGCQWEHSFGAAYVFDLVEDAWVETTVLLPPDASGDFVFFGWSVAVDGDRVLVGAPGWIRTPLFPEGAAYLFALVDGSWELVANYPGSAAGATTISELGRAVAIDDELLLIGDPGYADFGIVKLERAPRGRFGDDENTVHQGDIDTIAAAGITRGCNPPLNTEFCPTQPVTRGEMAAFLKRALDLPAPATDHFVDDDGSLFEDDINAIAEVGITLGCNPPANDRYCPDHVVTRDTMAAFVRRGFGYPFSDLDRFADDDGSIYEEDINAIAAAGIARGCDPPVNFNYCPTDPVTRQQMASFLARALAGDD